MVTEGECGPNIVLTAPLGLEGQENSSNYRAPGLLNRILSILSSIHPGSDLRRLQLPPLFNLPKSQLQCYGESVYCINSDMLRKCEEGKTPLCRFVSVVAWSISTIRPLAFGLAPYNPVLGETHHVSRGTLNVLIEQVSHHPPVTALHATIEKDNIELLWCQSPVPKFYGTHVETEVQGKRHLKLHNKDETYTMNSPNLVIRFLPMPRVDWVGTVTIKCQETGLEAELNYRGISLIPLPSMNRSIKGKIFLSSTSQTMCEIYGHWDRTITSKDVSTGKSTTIYDAKEALHRLNTPIVKNSNAVSPSESTVVWGEVSQAILQKSWDRAREAKTCIEERQRELARERKSTGECWTPKYFTVSHSNDMGWECSPNHSIVPPAPIVVEECSPNHSIVPPAPIVVEDR